MPGGAPFSQNSVGGCHNGPAVTKVQVRQGISVGLSTKGIRKNNFTFAAEATWHSGLVPYFETNSQESVKVF